MNQNYSITINLGGMWVIALLTFIVFLILKLVKLITWSWVWVFSPIWIAGGIWLILFLFLVTVMLVERLRG
jgi:hypothetical protein